MTIPTSARPDAEMATGSLIKRSHDETVSRAATQLRAIHAQTLQREADLAPNTGHGANIEEGWPS